MNNYPVRMRGKEKVVIVPFQRWQADQRKLNKLKQMMKFKSQLLDSFREAEEMMSGKRKQRTLDDLLNEL